MRIITTSLLFVSLSFAHLYAQDTFSIVAVDSVTGEVGSAGASCVDMINFPGFATDFIGELFPGVGAINTQASYDLANQQKARFRMQAGDTPAQIIDHLKTSDVGSNPEIRQYGIVALVDSAPQAAAFTGANCLDYKNHIVGPNYAIQGNILLGQQVLDSMEARFIRAKGDLACKLMAALQGANIVGADTRCDPNGTSSLFAFVKVAQPTDMFRNPSFVLSVKTRSNAGIEPIDTLQSLFDAARACNGVGVDDEFTATTLTVFPNPTDATLTIRLSSSPSKPMAYKISSQMGQLIQSGQIQGKIAIDTKGWTKGIYVVEVEGNGQFTTKKVTIF